MKLVPVQFGHIEKCTIPSTQPNDIHARLAPNLPDLVAFVDVFSQNPPQTRLTMLTGADADIFQTAALTMRLLAHNHILTNPWIETLRKYTHADTLETLQNWYLDRPTAVIEGLHEKLYKGQRDQMNALIQAAELVGMQPDPHKKPN